MFSSTAFLRAASVAVLLPAAAVHAQSALPAEPVRLDSFAAFEAPTANWQLAAGLAGDPRREKVLAAAEGTGVLICNPGKEKERRGHLVTAWEHGDLELELEFLMAPGSNSGVYLQGRYEVQLFDSWGKSAPQHSDCGGIYQRWDGTRGKGKEGFEGFAPLANAARAPGLWQTLRVEFQAPRFDAAGKKIKNARFAKVVLNGFTVQEDVEVSGPTRSSLADNEVPLGPLMIQGDHGAVAVRRLAVKRFDADTKLQTENLRYKLYAGSFTAPGSYDKQTPKAEGVPARFAHGAVEKSGRFALVFTGDLVVPRAGAYRFSVEGGVARFTVGDRAVVSPLDRGTQPGVVTLAAGKHPFRLDLLHNANNRPTFELVAEGPGIAPHAVTVRERDARAAAKPKTLAVEPTDRVLLQRGFVPFEPRKRLYAASVGTPAGVHYAYDFETGALLRAWRGAFADTVDMWDGRGNDQVAKPTGPSLTFNAKPAVALIEYARLDAWPDAPEALWSSQGYELRPDGQPVFLSTLHELSVRDTIAPAADGRGLARTLQFTGKLPSWSTWVLLAEADTIVPQADGRGWVIGDRTWYVDWPADAAHRPVVRTAGSKQQLAVPLSAGLLEKPLAYSIVW